MAGILSPRSSNSSDDVRVENPLLSGSALVFCLGSNSLSVNMKIIGRAGNS